MDMHKHRRDRLHKLLAAKPYKGDRQALEAAGDLSSSRLTQLLSSTYRDGKGFGEGAARKLEKKLGLKSMYFDQITAVEAEDFQVPTDEYYEIIPKLDMEASCGHGKFNDFVTVNGGQSFDREMLKTFGITPKNGRVIKASGQSMEPTIGNGRAVLIKIDDTVPQDNRVYLICDCDNAMFLKRLVRDFDPATSGMVWKMRSDNPDKRQYADKPLPDSDTATIVGRAVWHDGVL